MSRALTECSNCSQRFEAHYPYCPYCGQQSENKLTLGVLFNNTISNYFSVDARFFRSFIPLMFKPGYLAQRFVKGQRSLYLHPAQMYLFISVVFFFLFSFISRQQADDLNTSMNKAFDRESVVKDSIQLKADDSLQRLKVKTALEKNKFLTGMNQKEIDSILKDDNSGGSDLSFGMHEDKIDSLIKINADDKTIYKAMGLDDDANMFQRSFYKQYLKFYKKRSFGEIVKSFYDTVPIAMFILLPIFALLLKIFYFNKGQFSFHLVFSFYFFAFLFTVFSILVFASLVWKDFPWWIIMLVMFSTYFYLFLGVKRFYGQGYFLSFIKSNVVSFVFLSMVLPFAFIIMGLIAFLFY